jgi:drug/metabolite transporter (DMT)-like permease
MWRAADAPAWAAALFLGLGVSIGAFGLYNMALARMPAGRASMAINLVPPTALLAGVVCRGDMLTPGQMLACAVIAAGVLMGHAGAKRPRAATPPPLSAGTDTPGA